MEYRVLGPLEVLEEGKPLALGTLKERMVLAVLLLHANEFVSRERLIDELWGSAPPPTATKAVNVYISKLRQTLARTGQDPIATVDGGYRLIVERDQLDTDRVRSLVTRARERMMAGESDAASERLEQALALWRGPTLAGLALESLGRDEVAQLDELRLTVLMDRIDCDLAQGRHEDVLGELQVLIREHPLRERLRAQQMLALYRADRQADALDAYRQARQTLTEELGIEPSESLQRLHQAILQHDPALEAPMGTAAVNGSARTPLVTGDIGAPRRRFRPRRWQIGLAAALVVLAAVGLVAATLSASSGAAPRVRPNTLVWIDPHSGKITSVVKVGADPGSIAITPDAIWTANAADSTVSRYDLRTHIVQTRGGVPGDPYDIVADSAGNAWVSSEASDVTRMAASTEDTSRGQRVRITFAPTILMSEPGAGSLAIGGGYLWVIPGPLTLPGDNRLMQVNLATSIRVRTLRLKGDTSAIAYGAGAAWVTATYRNNGLLYAIPPGLGPPRVSTVELGGGTFGMAIGEGGIWVLSWGTNGGVGTGSVQQVIEVDPRTGQVVRRTTFDGQDLWAIAAGGGSVWALADASVIQLDPKNGQVIRTIQLRPRPKAPTCSIAASNDGVWVTMGTGKCSTGSA